MISSTFKHWRARRRVLFTGSVFTALVLLSVAAFMGDVPRASANAGDPDSTQSTWHYVAGTSGPISVTVTGAWSWGDNSLPKGGKDSQSCASGGTVSSTYASGHEAVGIAVSWNDASTPNVLTGKGTNGNTITLHVGDSMDWTNGNYCAGTTTAAPYPSGTFTASHQYPSYAAFFAATSGLVCANAYDVHKVAVAKETDPSKNGDNTLHNGHYALTTDCATSVAPTNPGLSFKKLERIGANGSFVPGPVTGAIGDIVFYEMLATNIGDTKLDVTLADPRCDTGTVTPAGAVVLYPGDVATFTCSHKLVAGDGPQFVNTAVATAGFISKTSSVTATVKSGAVKGKQKKVVKKAKPTRPVVKAASFTG